MNEAKRLGKIIRQANELDIQATAVATTMANKEPGNTLKTAISNLDFIRFQISKRDIVRRPIMHAAKCGSSREKDSPFHTADGIDIKLIKPLSFG
ncbi:MAG TPA: hypothetical protein PKC98_18055, partial [Candidatus Melainabacteria bacterium]|nr:hypothetical protein [Candidatus Melainabacteria bacterium]